MIIKLTAEVEETSPEEAVGYMSGFANAIAEMRATAEGNWGWCTVKLEVNFDIGDKTLVGTSYLGQCSYESDVDFVKNSGYFEDMLRDAIAEALGTTTTISSVDKHIDTLRGLIDGESDDLGEMLTPIVDFLNNLKVSLK